jgi:hypothetical protein
VAHPAINPIPLLLACLALAAPASAHPVALISPADGAVVDDPTLIWQPGAGDEQSYTEVYLDGPGQGYGDVPATFTNGETFYTPSGLRRGEYSWYVVNHVSEAASSPAASETRAFFFGPRLALRIGQELGRSRLVVESVRYPNIEVVVSREGSELWRAVVPLTPSKSEPRVAHGEVDYPWTCAGKGYYDVTARGTGDPAFQAENITLVGTCENRFYVRAPRELRVGASLLVGSVDRWGRHTNYRVCLSTRGSRRCTRGITPSGRRWDRVRLKGPRRPGRGRLTWTFPVEDRRYVARSNIKFFVPVAERLHPCGAIYRPNIDGFSASVLCVAAHTLARAFVSTLSCFDGSCDLSRRGRKWHCYQHDLGPRSDGSFAYRVQCSTKQEAVQFTYYTGPG